MKFFKLIKFNLKKDLSFLEMTKVSLLFLLFTTTTNAAQLQSQVVNITPSTLPKNAVRVPFVSLNLKALDGAVNISGLTVQRSGLSSHEDFGRIWAETNNYHRTPARHLSNDDQVELKFRTPLTIKENQTIQITVYANLKFKQAGRTAQLNLIEISHDGEGFTPAPKPVVEPSISRTKSRIPYDRSQYRIKCIRGRCHLVPKD